MSLNQLRQQANVDDGGQPDEPTQPSALPNHYCTDKNHSPRILTEDRFFYWDDDQPGCPICPVCNKQVSAQRVGVDARGRPQIPANLLALSSRIGEPV